MTRVVGQLFDDKRNGVLALKASKAFFGSSRDEQHFEVVDGAVDFDIAPTPRGVFYNVGFKDLGDIRSTTFTLKWTVPSTGTVNVGSDKAEPIASAASTPPVNGVQVKRLASELSTALELARTQEREIADIQERERLLRQKFDQHKRDIEQVLLQRDQHISRLSMVQAPKIKTVYKQVPVAPKALEERIINLERENKRLQDLSDTYYQAYVELHQLKLERAQSAPVPNTVTGISGSPRQRLINKLLAN